MRRISWVPIGATILYGSRTESGIAYRKELDEVCASCDKVRVVHILSDEEKPG